MKLTREQYEIADNFLEYLRSKNCRERATVTLINDKDERIEKLEQYENDSKAINILIQVLNNADIKEV